LDAEKYNFTDSAVLLELDLSSTIAALETFNFAINDITNPTSTRPSDEIHVAIFDSASLASITNEDTGNLVAITSVPYTVSPDAASLDQSVVGAGLISNYTLTMSLTHDIAEGGGVLIRYPPQVAVAGELSATVDAKSYDPDVGVLDRPAIDESARQILFATDAFDRALYVDGSDTPADAKQLVITIVGLRNPYSNEASSSFEIVTFDQDDNVLYFVDRVVDGLRVSSDCAYPCQDCADDDASFCLACDPDSLLPFLQESTCLAKCSDGRYYDAARERCVACATTCLTCEGTARTCTSCGVGDYLHLRGTECVVRCGDGYIDDPSENQCVPCRGGCATCDISDTNCTSCEARSAPSAPLYLFDYECLDECPSGISVFRNELCLPCAAKCKTCEDEPEECVTCESYMRFDPLNRDCLEACVADVQVYDALTGRCHTCHENCESCVGDVDTCTSCKAGFVLNMESSCTSECSAGPPNQTPVDGVCRECAEPCKTCSGKIDTCTACMEDYLLYKNTCVDHCPEKYEENGAEINQCVLVGLVCPEGFHVNDAGEGCVPNEFECEEGYEINDKRTACIPAPGSPIPFPFLFMAVCMGLVVAGSHMKEKNLTKVPTCLIFLIGSMEILEYSLIAIFAARLEQSRASLLALLAVVMLAASNIAFVGYYKKYTMDDKAYADWIRIFPKTKIALPIICSLVNFKVVRFVFSGFFGMDNCLATFDEPRSAVHKLLKMMTYFQWVFVYAPIFLADLLILAEVGWGHQLLVLAIETAVLQTVVLILTWREFKNPDQLYADGEGQYSSLKPRKNGQIAVMGAFEEDGMDETHLIRQDKRTYEYEVMLRKKALTAILQQVG